MSAPMRLACFVLVASTATACEMDFAPITLLDDLRVLAVVADPPEAGPGETVDLSAWTYHPPEESLTEESWSFCALSTGPRGAYACAIPECETELEARGSSVSVALDELLLGCAERVGASGAGGAQLPEKLETVFRYRARTPSTQREAVLTVPFFPRGVPEPRNSRPTFRSVTLSASQARAGDEIDIEVLLGEDAVESFEDSLGAPSREDPIVSYFSTSGELEADRTNGGTSQSNRWSAVEIPPNEPLVELFLVVRDGRGGQAASGPHRIELVP